MNYEGNFKIWKSKSLTKGRNLVQFKSITTILRRVYATNICSVQILFIRY